MVNKVLCDDINKIRYVQSGPEVYGPLSWLLINLLTLFNAFFQFLVFSGFSSSQTIGCPLLTPYSHTRDAAAAVALEPRR